MNSETNHRKITPHFLASVATYFKVKPLRMTAKAPMITYVDNSKGLGEVIGF